MQERSFETLFGGEDSNTSATPGAEPTTPRRGRKPRTTANAVVISKAAIVDILSLANMPIQLSGYGAFALTAQEIDSLADAWHKVIKQNPSIAKYLVVGEKLGVWGNLIFVHVQIASSRLTLWEAMQKQTARRATSSNGASDKPISELLS